MTSFEQAFAILIGHEGGLDTTASDPGNWTGRAVGRGELRGTKYGISAATYPNLDIASLTQSDAQKIYRRDFWDRIQADHLPPQLALLVFDAAVNNGPAHATTWLQKAANVPDDGSIGPVTLAAVASRDVTSLASEFMARRIDAMARDPDWSVFGLGWARRLSALPYQSLTMT